MRAKKKFTSRFLTVVLILLVVCGMMPMTVFADYGRDFGEGNSLHLEYWDQELMITGSGDIPDGRLYHDYDKCICTIVIYNGVTGVGQNAFSRYTALQRLIIGDDVTHIDAGAFQNLPYLKYVTIGSSVVSIGENAFAGCTGLERVSYAGGPEEKTTISIAPGNELLEATKWDFCQDVASVRVGEAEPVSFKDFSLAWAYAVANDGEMTLLTDWVARVEDRGYGSWWSFLGVGSYFEWGSLYVPGGHSVILDLNGYKIDRMMSDIPQGQNAPVIIIGNDYQSDNTPCSLTIRDSSDTARDGTGTGMITGTYCSDGYAGGVNVVENGQLILESGSICGNKGGAGGVLVWDSSTGFLMTGGAIKDNIATAWGGGVHVGGKFTMTGGVITGNICGMNASYAFGGGVAIHSQSTEAELIVGGTAQIYGNTFSCPYSTPRIPNPRDDNVYLGCYWAEDPPPQRLLSISTDTPLTEGANIWISTGQTTPIWDSEKEAIYPTVFTTNGGNVENARFFHSDDPYYSVLANNGVLNLDVHSHTWSDWRTTRIAYPGVAGEEVRECTICLQTETREIPALEVDKVKTFVTRLYQNFLGRDPKNGEDQNWVTWLKSGKVTGASAVYGFVYSKEFQKKPLSNETYVTAMYQTIFGRDPDQKGLKTWVGYLENGCTRKMVLQGLLNSKEMQELCKDMGIQAGSYISDEVVDKNPKVAAFVSRLYTVCLGRKFDTSGMKTWTGLLVDKKYNAKQVADGFYFSNEFLKKNMSDADFIANSYRTILGREADGSGTKTWTNYLKAHTRNEMLNGFYYSTEFKKMCAEYGINFG